MNKTKGLFFTASLALALTLTQSCSGDDGGGGGDPSSSSGGETQGGGDPSSSSGGEPSGGGGVNFAALSNKQVYLVTGSGNDYVKTGNSTDNSDLLIASDFPVVGTIQNGFISLNLLPDESVIQLRDFWDLTRCKDFDPARYSSCVSNISVPPNLQANVNDISFHLTASGKENCRVKLYTEKSNKLRPVRWGYFSKAGSVSGTETFTYTPERGGETNSEIFDISFSEGWNLMYTIDENNGVMRGTTTLPAGTTLEWGLYCN
jgi:hypothetical protein